MMMMITFTVHCEIVRKPKKKKKKFVQEILAVNKICPRHLIYIFCLFSLFASEFENENFAENAQEM